MANNGRHHQSNQLQCSCGFSLHSDHTFCPQCGQQVRMTCRNCGRVAAPTHTFCAGCGNRLKSVIPSLRKEQEKIEADLRECEQLIYSIELNSNLYLGYQQQLENSRGRALLADAASSFFSSTPITSAGITYVQQKNKIDWALLELGQRLIQAQARHTHLGEAWQKLEDQIQEARLQEERRP